MRKLIAPVAVLFFVLLFAASTAYASMLYVDVAPNSSDEYSKWWKKTKKKIKKGKFVNMKNGANPDNKGTTNYEIEDTTGYNFGDYGSSLTFIYWLPGESKKSLKKQNFKIAADYFIDEVKYSFTEEVFGKKWVKPKTWKNWNGGVIGTAGISWANPFVDTEDKLADEIAYWDMLQGDIIFKTKWGNQKSKLRAKHDPSAPVPEPGTVLLFGTGLLGIAGYRRRILK